MNKGIPHVIFLLGLLGLVLAACTSAPAYAARWEGTVEAILPDGLQVSGRLVRWTGQTQVLGEVRVGSRVEVEGIPTGDALSATVIRVQSSNGSTAAGALVSPLPTPTLQAEIEFKGVVEAILPEGYQIAGRTVVVTTTTRIEGPIAVGTFVEVKGTLQPDGTILASRIQREREGQPTIEFQGVVEEILPDGYRIAGHTVIVTATTRIEGSIAVGTFVEVKGIPQPDGTVLALRIHVEDEDRQEVEFKGVVEAILPNGYQVSGRLVVVTDTTKVKGPVAVGDWVKVKGFLQHDGSILAREIQTLKSPKSAQVEFKGTVEEILPNGYRIAGITVVVTATTRIEGSIAVGTFVEVKGIPQPDGTVLALRIHVEDEDRQEVEFKGVVEAILPDGYQISGRMVRVDGSTQIDGAIGVGAFVEVKGFVQGDGSIRAVRIHLEGDQKSGGGKVEESKKSGDDGKSGDEEHKDGEHKDGEHDD